MNLEENPKFHGLTPALNSAPRIILFTDWDGTVTLQDSNDYLTDNIGFGEKKRRALNKKTLDGTATFRDTFHEMLDSINLPFDDCVDLLLANIELDPGFAHFYKWAAENNVPVVVVSSGMEPIIRSLLTKLVGTHASKNIQIIANGVEIERNGDWKIIYRDESSYGHDKARCIRPYSSLNERPLLLYAGDGVSDLSAARETDLLFAKTGRDLVEWCRREKIPYTEFSSYADIHRGIEALLSGTLQISDLLGNTRLMDA